jgi:MFS family permease
VAGGSWYATDVTSLVAVSVMAFDLGGPGAVGLVGAIRMLPTALLGGAVGVADRFPRPRVVAAVNVALVLVAVTMAVLADTGGSVAALTLVVAVGAALSVPLKPSLQAMLPQLARRPQDLARVNSAYSTVTSIGSVLGPALGGALLAARGAVPVWLVLAAVYAATALVAVSIRTPFQPPRRTGTGGRWRAAWTVPFQGLRALAPSGARVLFGLFMVQRVMLGMVNVFVVLYAHDVAGADGDGLSGGFFTALGVGGLLGSVLSFAATGRRGRVWFAIGIALWGLPVAVLGAAAGTAAGGAVAGLVAFTAVGVGNAFAGIFGYSLVNRLLADHLAGRGWGAFHSVGAVAVAAGSLGAPPLVDLLGLSGAMLTTGLLVTVAPLACTAGLRALEAATTPRPEDVELLGGVGVLAPLPRLTLERLACAADRREVATGVPVVREHAAGEEFFVVESGSLVVRREAVDVRRLGPGDAFGEVALLRSVPRTATVLTTGPSVLLSLRREDFVATVTGHRPTDAGADGAVSELLAADARRGAPGPRRPTRPGG